MYTTTVCPVCGSGSLKPLFEAIDKTVSHETFHLVMCENCSLLVTNPRPDDNELPKYYMSDEYISHSSKAKTIVDKLYRLARIYTLQWKVKLLQSYLSPSDEIIRILDYGCGTGSFLYQCHKQGYVVKGVEPSDHARNQAKALLDGNVTKLLSEINDEFDAITLWHVLEHLPDINNSIIELANKLRKNGVMFIAVPNHRSYDAVQYKNNWAAFDVPRHLWHFNRTSMAALLQKHHLKLQEIIPMKLDAYYVSILSEKYLQPKKIVSAIFKGIVTAFRSNAKAKGTFEYSSLIYVIKKS